MTATAASLQDYVDTLRRAIPYVHPVGRASIECWLSEMEIAATFARFAIMIGESGFLILAQCRQVRPR